MAITKGAKKAHRASLHKHVFNLRRKKTMNEALKQVRKLVVAGKREDAQALVPQAYQAIDKATKRGVIKANTAARKKSRLVGAIARMGK
ncbi:30S ribosomal protein S20 [Candidatus Kaiserbacteria bacterium]|nr:30S ribosomal protein S20 [Candidatus Kaiserbacteria bacterium]